MNRIKRQQLKARKRRIARRLEYSSAEDRGRLFSMRRPWAEVAVTRNSFAGLRSRIAPLVARWNPGVFVLAKSGVPPGASLR